MRVKRFLLKKGRQGQRRSGWAPYTIDRVNQKTCNPELHEDYNRIVYAEHRAAAAAELAATGRVRVLKEPIENLKFQI